MLSPKFLLGLLTIALSFVSLQSQVQVNARTRTLYQIQLRFVVTENSNGERANGLGNSEQRAYINEQMNRIFGQFGAEVIFPESDDIWVNDFAYAGEGEGERAGEDLDIIFETIPSEFYDPNDGVVTVVFTTRSPAFDFIQDFQIRGIAFLNTGGTVVARGDQMLRNNNNMEVVAALIAHEIGHNFGLRHIADQTNLMNATVSEGEINSAQLGQILNNRFLHGLLANIGVPDLGIFRNLENYIVGVLRSTSGAYQLVTSLDPNFDLKNGIATNLVNGVFVSEVNALRSQEQIFFSVEESESQPENSFQGIGASSAATSTESAKASSRESCACSAEEGRP